MFGEPEDGATNSAAKEAAFYLTLKGGAFMEAEHTEMRHWAKAKLGQLEAEGHGS